MKNVVWFAIAFLAWWFFPDDLELGGLLVNTVLFLAAVSVLTPFLVYAAIRKSLPERPEFRPAGDADLLPAMAAPLRAFESQGFARAGPALRAMLGNEVLVVPLIHPDRARMAAVYGVGGRTPKTFFDVVSVFPGERGGLTTGMDAGGGVLPGERGALKQLFPGLGVEALCHNHDRALEWAAGRGLAAMPVAPEDVPRLLRKSVHTARRVFLRHPARHTLVALWRTLTKRNPHLMPLPEQPGADADVKALASAPRPRPEPAYAGAR